MIRSFAFLLLAVTLGGVAYDQVAAAPESTELVDQIDKTEALVPPPSTTAAEVASGFVVYVAAEPGNPSSYRVPEVWKQEHVTNLSAFLTPGEDKASWFGLYALEELQDLAVTVEAKDAPFTVDVRNMWFWTQQLGRETKKSYVCPELLLPCRDGRTMAPVKWGVLEWRPFGVKAKESAGLWLTVTAPPDATPGRYSATIRISSRGKPDLALPFTVEILPFVLQRPSDRHWLVWCDAQRWEKSGGMTDEQVMLDLRDFARHGMTGLIELPLGVPDCCRLKDGRVSFDASRFIKLTRLAAEAGLPGPHVNHYKDSSRVRNAVREALGLSGDDLREGWPPEYREGLVATVRAAVKAAEEAQVEWYWYGTDEPSGKRVPVEVRRYEALRAGGAKPFVTWMTGDFLQEASLYLDVICFGRDTVAPKRHWYLHLRPFGLSAPTFCERIGAELWSYGAGTCEGIVRVRCPMASNRKALGFEMWKSGARGYGVWTFQRPYGDPFNEKPGHGKMECVTYPHLLRPKDWSTYQGAIPTIAWEAIREGVNDYAYLYTLHALIQKARRSNNAAVLQAAAQASEKLMVLPSKVVGTWSGGTTPKRVDGIVREIADETVALQAAMADQR